MYRVFAPAVYPLAPAGQLWYRVDVLEHLYKYSTYRAQKNLLEDKYVASSTYSRCVKAEAYVIKHRCDLPKPEIDELFPRNYPDYHYNEGLLVDKINGYIEL